MSVAVDRVSDEAAFEALAPRWDALFSATRPRSVFQSFAWCRSWWRAVGRHDPACSLSVLVLSEGGRDVALAPLVVHESASGRSLGFLGGPWPDAQDVLLDPSLPRPFPPLLDALRERALRDRVGLDEIPPTSNLLGEGVSPASPAPAGFALEAASRSPRLGLTDDAAFARAIGKANVVAGASRLERLGPLAARHHAEPAAIAERLPAFRAMHLAQWRGRTDAVAPFGDPDVDRFFDETVDRMGAAGLLLLSELTLGGRPIAFAFGYRLDGVYGFYRTAFDAAYAAHSPGHVLLRELFLFLRASGFSTFDFLRGAYAYKYRYANGERAAVRLVSRAG